MSNKVIEVLYVEDDLGLARLVQKRLERLEYRVDIAKDGHSGLKMIMENEYDVIAIDHEMPGMTGLEVIRNLVSQENPPPIIMITGQGDELLAVEAMKLGVSEYLVKDTGGQYLDSLVKIFSRVIERQELIEKTKRTEQALKESEEKYRLLFNSSSDAVLVVAEESDRIIDANSSALKLYGYSYSDLMARKWGDFDAGEPENFPLPVGEGGNNNRPIAFQKHKNGAPISVEISSSKMYLFSQATKIYCVRDISQRLRADAEREKLELQLRQAQKMESIGRLAGGVAHDYNNALTSIIGFTQLVKEVVEPGSQIADDLGQVLAAADKAKEITRQLLGFARQQTIKPMSINLNDTIESLLKMIRRLIGEDVDLVWLPKDGLDVVKIDPTQIDQILMNLCVNARDAIVGVGNVTIETDNVLIDEEYCAAHVGFKPGQFVMMAVSDNGYGIDAKTLENIFEPFFTTKPKGKGTGLGLSTVYGIVKQNNGFINAYSEPGRGSTFKIYLPQFEGDVKPVTIIKDSGDLNGCGETILLVEDDKRILKLAEKVLISMNYKVLTADSPTQALDLVKDYSGEIDVLLTDVVMPNLNGKELSILLKKTYPALKVVYMSGYTENAIAHHGVLDSGVHFIHKPFTKQSLGTILRELLAKPNISLS